MGMNRKQFLAGAGAAFTILKYTGANAAEFTYKLGHDQPVSHPQNIRAVEAAERVGRESDGRLVVNVYPNNQLGGDPQMLSQIRSGALELMQLGDNILASIVPVTSVADLPFTFAGYPELWAAMDGGLGKHIRGEIAKAGLHVFDKGWDAGLRHVLTNGKQIRKPEDLVGMKLRVPNAPIQIATFRALGASPTAINNSELYTAIQTHLVDGAEQPLISIESARLYEVSSQISLTGHMPTSFEMLANAAAFNRLPDDLKTILTRAFDEAALLERADIANGETALIEKLKGLGQTIIKPDPAPFKQAIHDAGLYKKWRETYGETAMGLLENAVGKLT